MREQNNNTPRLETYAVPNKSLQRTGWSYLVMRRVTSFVPRFAAADVGR